MMLSHRRWRRAACGVTIAIVASVATVASAQQTPAAPAVPTLPTPQPEPPAATLAAAREVVVASGMSRSFAPMVPDLMRQIVPTVTRTHPELQKDLSDVVKDLEPEFVKDGEHMTDIAAHVFARRMSEDELKQTAAFFRSPAGVQYVKIQPEMLDELVVAMQSWTQELSNIMMRRVRDEMLKRGHSMM